MDSIALARLRQQNMNFEIPDMSGGTMDMGVIGPPPTSSPYEIDPFEQEQPIYNQQPVMDPRTPVNPTIAGPQEQPVGGPGSTGDMAMQRTMDAIDRIYTPETTSRDRFNRLLDAAPERERPSALSGIAAFGMGMSAKDPLDALKVHESVMFAPHHRNMADWTAKTGPFGNAAQYENTANVNERNLASSVVTAQQRADEQASRERIADQKNEATLIRNRAYALKQGGWTFDFSTPNIIATSPTGEIRILGKTGEMDEADKIGLENTGRLAVANANQQGQLAVQGSRNAGALAVQTLRNAGVTGSGGTRGLLPSQIKDQLYNKAQQWILEHPEDKPFITLDAQGNFDVVEPGTSIFGRPTGMPPDRYDAFISNLYGSGGATPQGMPTPPNAPPMPIGGGPVQPGQQNVPQGQNRPQFETPPGIDPHGRPPVSQSQVQTQPQARPQLRIATDPRVPSQGTMEPTSVTGGGNLANPSPQIQTLLQIDQKIKALEAQLATPVQPITTPPPVESVNANDQSIVGQRFRQNAGIPAAPPSFQWPTFDPNTSTNSISDRQFLQEAGRGQQPVIQAQAQQQQMMSELAQLNKQKQQIINSINTPQQPVQQAAPAQQQQAPKTGFATNKQTGQKVPVVSYDGGVTWEFK